MVTAAAMGTVVAMTIIVAMTTAMVTVGPAVTMATPSREVATTEAADMEAVVADEEATPATPLVGTAEGVCTRGDSSLDIELKLRARQHALSLMTWVQLLELRSTVHC